VRLAAAVLLAIVPATTRLLADWSYEQNFDALTPGNLHGQDSWTGFNVSGQSNYRVETNVVYQGTKAVQVPLSTHSTIDRPLPVPIAAGDFYIAMRKTHTSNSTLFTVLRDARGVNRVFVRLGTDGNISAFDNVAGSYIALAPYSADTWYPINIQFDAAAHPNQFRVRALTRGTWTAWSSWITANGGSYTTLTTLRLDTDAVGDTAGHIGYFDAISATDISRPGAVRAGIVRPFTAESNIAADAVAGGPAYSARRAVIGSTRVARRDGR
jgi:hypothetical protein